MLKGSENVQASARLSWAKALPVAVALAVGFLVGASVVAVASHAFGPVRLDRQVSGVVTIVNADGSSFCLDEDNGGAQFCSDVLKRADTPAPIVGQRLTGTTVWTPVPGAFSEGLLVGDDR
jgi:hypothetical protein